MDHRTSLLLTIGVGFVVVPLIFALVLWVVLRLWRTSDRSSSLDVPGATRIPVRQLQRTSGFFGGSDNSLNPRLTVAPDGLRFKVFKPDCWRFPDIAEVDVLPVPFVTRIVVRHRAGGRLYIDLDGASRARDLLRILPPDLPLTPRAAALRDGTG